MDALSGSRVDAIGILEEEGTHALGRARYQRQGLLDAPSGYRKGHGKPRKLSFASGTIEVKRPRVRGLEERFESAILPAPPGRGREDREGRPSRMYGSWRHAGSRSYAR